MFGFNLTRHEHLEGLQNHHKIHGSVVLSCWLLFCVQEFIGVKCVVHVHDLSRLTSWSVVALCLEITRPLRNVLSLSLSHTHTHTQNCGTMCFYQYYNMKYSWVLYICNDNRGYFYGFPYNGQIQNSKSCVILCIRSLFSSRSG
jgi:hypothetical protein